MMNALWFRPDNGKDRYYRDYGAAVLPLLEEAGAEIVMPFLEVEDALEGGFDPDVVGIVRYPSVEAFERMWRSDAYRPAAAHARGALDRRVLTRCRIEPENAGPATVRPGVVVANLLWFNERGRERYDDYLDAARPFVESVGGQYVTPRFVPEVAVEDDLVPDLVFFGSYPSKEAVFELVSGEQYQAVAAPIRTEAVARSLTTVLRVP